MTEAKSIIKQYMAKIRLEHDCELANEIGLTKQSLSRKLRYPRTFSWYEVGALAKLFNWSNEELGEFVRSVYGGKE